MPAPEADFRPLRRHAVIIGLLAPALTLAALQRAAIADPGSSSLDPASARPGQSEVRIDPLLLGAELAKMPAFADARCAMVSGQLRCEVPSLARARARVLARDRALRESSGGVSCAAPGLDGGNGLSMTPGLVNFPGIESAMRDAMPALGQAGAGARGSDASGAGGDASADPVGASFLFALDDTITNDPGYFEFDESSAGSTLPGRGRAYQAGQTQLFYSPVPNVRIQAVFSGLQVLNGAPGMPRNFAAPGNFVVGPKVRVYVNQNTGTSVAVRVQLVAPTNESAVRQGLAEPWSVMSTLLVSQKLGPNTAAHFNVTKFVGAEGPIYGNAQLAHALNDVFTAYLESDFAVAGPGTQVSFGAGIQAQVTKHVALAGGVMLNPIATGALRSARQPVTFLVGLQYQWDPAQR